MTPFRFDEARQRGTAHAQRTVEVQVGRQGPYPCSRRLRRRSSRHLQVHCRPPSRVSSLPDREVPSDGGDRALLLDAVAQPSAPRHSRSYSSWRRYQTLARRSPAPTNRLSLRPRGARSSHWYMPQRPSSPRAYAAGAHDYRIVCLVNRMQSLVAVWNGDRPGLSSAGEATACRNRG
jgi:hypothetical protein